MGSIAQRNRLWLSYRNFLRQAISNFRAALTVENRSASLLYYYAMMNFAKAELLRVQPASVEGFVPHGLTFNGHAKTVGGDFLTVRDGVFRMLYQRRTGYQLPPGTRLPVRRLLGHIPEIGDQLGALKAGRSAAAGVLQLIAFGGASAWTVLAITEGAGLEDRTASGRYFRRAFRLIEPPRDWKDKFGVSRRWRTMDFYESRAQFPYTPGDDAGLNEAVKRARENTWTVKDLFGLTNTSMWDACPACIGPACSPCLLHLRGTRLPTTRPP
jgi:hypothetical protein